MGLSESPTEHPEKQGRRRRRLPRRPRTRRCLLNGCEQRFHPRQARQRYCSERYRAAARKWSRWKAQQRYRGTKAGKRRRNGQSQRYRERERVRKPSAPEAVGEPARVITKKFFSRLVATGPVATSDLIIGSEVLCNTSARKRAGGHWNGSTNASGAGTRPVFKPEILIATARRPYIQPV